MTLSSIPPPPSRSSSKLCERYSLPHTYANLCERCTLHSRTPSFLPQ
jgi:hypothetical protein